MAASGTSTLIEDCRLILEVQKNPILWDNRLREYRNKQRQEVIWKCVAEILGANVTELTYRWGNLRCRYVREKRKKKCGIERDESVPPWYLMEQMDFLSDTIKHRRIFSTGLSPLLSSSENREVNFNVNMVNVKCEESDGGLESQEFCFNQDNSNNSLDVPLHPVSPMSLSPLSVSPPTISPTIVPSSAVSLALVPRSVASPAFAPQSTVSSAFLPQSTVTPALVPRSAVSLALVSPSSASAALVPRSAVSPVLVPRSAVSLALVSPSTASPTLVPRSAVSLAFVSPSTVHSAGPSPATYTVVPSTHMKLPETEVNIKKRRTTNQFVPSEEGPLAHGQSNLEKFKSSNVRLHADEHFLLSMFPDIVDLPVERKMRVKAKFIQVLIDDKELHS